MLLSESNQHQLNEGERYQKYYRGQMAKVEASAKQYEAEFNKAKANKDVKGMKRAYNKTRSAKMNLDPKNSAKAAAIGGAIGGTIGSGNLAVGAVAGAAAGAGGYVGTKIGQKILKHQGVDKDLKKMLTRLTQLSAKMATEIAKHDTKFVKKAEMIKNESEEFDTHGNLDATLSNIELVLEEVDELLIEEEANTSALGNFSESEFLSESVETPVQPQPIQQRTVGTGATGLNLKQFNNAETISRVKLNRYGF